MTDEQTDEWLSVPDAALRLGMSESAVRSRIGRRTLRARKNNHGRIVVFVGETSANYRRNIGETSRYAPEPSQKPPDAQEMIPLSVHQTVLQTLQEAHKAALAAIETAHNSEREQWAAERFCLIDMADTALLHLEHERRRLCALLTRQALPWWRKLIDE